MTIKHIVINGGGPSGLISYSAIKTLHELKVWSYDDIETIYATSIGGIIGFIISMKFEWNIIDDYIIERPWSKAFESLNHNIFDIINNKGIDIEKFIYISTQPILAAKGLPYDITLKQLYEVTKIDLCLVSVDLNTSHSFHTEVISYKNYPNMPLNRALACSCAIPFIFTPVFYENKCFIDGGLTNNFPLKICIENTMCEQDEIIAFSNDLDNIKHLNSDTPIVDFVSCLIIKLICELNKTSRDIEIKNIIYLNVNDIISINTWYDIMECKEKRINLLERGVNIAKKFFNLNFRQETPEDVQCLV
jgi:NTE family protein